MFAIIPEGGVEHEDRREPVHPHGMFFWWANVLETRDGIIYKLITGI
jgi:hypothetical protein